VLESLGLFVACGVIGGASALLGLGGGMFVVPMLLLVVGLDPGPAAAVGLTCALCTSASGSVALDKARLADLRVVAILELPAAAGAFLGSRVLADVLPAGVIMLIFSALIVYAAWRMFQKARSTEHGDAGQAVPAYEVQGYPMGLFASGLAGVASGLLGIGGGPVKVPVQTEIMKLPMRVTLANSNLMVGITAGVGAASYYAKGDLPVAVAGPCALGIALGAYVGGRVAPKVSSRPLIFAFSGILLFMAVSILWKAATHVA
jgi:hypothetical protein